MSSKGNNANFRSVTLKYTLLFIIILIYSEKCEVLEIVQKSLFYKGFEGIKKYTSSLRCARNADK